MSADSAEKKKDLTAPAHQLLGRQLGSGWKVTQKIEPKPGATGSNFSVGYVVEKDGQKAFLKAFDYKEALAYSNPAKMLAAMTTAYNFECEVLDRCARKNFRRVVKALEFGAERVGEKDLIGVVQYVIFELASGDVRAHLEVTDKLGLVWKLRTLHQVATGLRQLHGESIAHQDLKPSNVLVFGDLDSKVADLGRASDKNKASPHDHHLIAGAWTYAPPELIYRFGSPDWDERRLGCDLYLFGSLIVFFFTGQATTTLLLQHLDSSHRPDQWKGMFHDVLPFLVDAFENVVKDFAESVPNEIRDNLVSKVRELCYPDPVVRGHPRSKGQLGARFSLERYVSEFDLLAQKAEVIMRGARK